MQADRVGSRRLPFVFVLLFGVSGFGGCDAPPNRAPTASKPRLAKSGEDTTQRAQTKSGEIATKRAEAKSDEKPNKRAAAEPRTSPPTRAEAETRIAPSTRANASPRSGRGAPTLGLAPLPADGDDGLVGPFTHANLSVYFVVRNNATDPRFITLAEGTSRGEVAVREHDAATVGSLLVDNRSDAPLFLHEGDRLKGGFQDRIVVASLVVPPHSGPVEVASLCIEQSRWGSEGDAGDVFESTSTAALSPKSVRLAAKVERDQTEVWRNVDLTKAKYADRFGAARLTSSLNEALDAPSSQRAAAAYDRALGPAALRYGNAVGAVFIVGDRIEEVDIYPGPSLFRTLYPRLLRSYAMDAAAADTSTAEPPPRATVIEFLATTGQGRSEQLDPHNRLEIHDLGSRWFLRTQYRGEVVHDQYMAKGG